MRKLLHCALLALSAAIVVPGASATPMAAAEWSGGQTLGSFDGPWTLGYRFNVSSAVTVTDLGAYDHNGDGLGAGSSVGLWTASGTLLASATVPAGTVAALDGHFRYADIVDVVLSAGDYVIGASDFGTGLSMGYAFSPVGFFTVPEITVTGTRYAGGSGLLFPAYEETGSARIGYFGGNFRVASVPEPATFALLGVGLAGLAASRRRKE